MIRIDVRSARHIDLENRPSQISFSDFGDCSLNLKVYYWYFMHEDSQSKK